MRIAEVLRGKGSAVVTVTESATVRQLLAVLAEHNVGAVVVSPDGVTVVGIASERDVVRHLNIRGATVLDERVGAIMTAVVHTCGPDDRVEGLRAVMTEHRIRHVPVLRAGRLAGIVSIGDVVKCAIGELQDEREHLVQYLRG